MCELDWIGGKTDFPRAVFERQPPLASVHPQPPLCYQQTADRALKTESESCWALTKGSA